MIKIIIYIIHDFVETKHLMTIVTPFLLGCDEVTTQRSASEAV